MAKASADREEETQSSQREADLRALEESEESTSTRTSLENFLEKNPNREQLKQVRDAKGGIFKVIDVAIFGFLLFAPALPIVPKMKSPEIVIILWVLIGLIMWCKIEYTHRAEVWYICLNRGIIIDFPKTNSLTGWLCQVPIFFALVFLFLFGLVTYIGLDPYFTFPEVSNLTTSILAIVGVLFVLLLTKGVVDLEGSFHLLTLNLVLHLFEDPKLLEGKGFKTVHFSQLQKFLRKQKASSKFSWNQIHELSHEKDDKIRTNLFAGTKMFFALYKYKDVDE